MNPMNSLIAKVESEYMNVLSQKNTIGNGFNASSIEAVDYTTSHKLDPEEWFRIKKFSKTGFFIEQCDPKFSTASLNQIKNSEYGNVSVITVLLDKEVHFQRTSPSLFVRKKTVLDYSGQPKIVEYNKQIVIKEKPDAVYLSESDELFFRSLSTIKVVFPGIEALHREATQPEVDTFLDNKFVEVGSNYSSEKVGPQNRKRIADIGAKYNELSKSNKKKLLAYTKQNTGLSLKGNAFVINSETDLKNLLYAMDQRYYFADIYEEKRLANSVRIVSK